MKVVIAICRPLSKASPIDKNTTHTISNLEASSIQANELAYWGVISLTKTFNPYKPIIEIVKKTIMKRSKSNSLEEIFTIFFSMIIDVERNDNPQKMRVIIIIKLII